MSEMKEGLCGHAITRYLAGKTGDAVSDITMKRPDGEPHITRFEDEETMFLVRCGKIGCADQCVLVNAFAGFEDRPEILISDQSHPETIVDICIGNPKEDPTRLC